jgi:hypothetical protein
VPGRKPHSRKSEKEKKEKEKEKEKSEKSEKKRKNIKNIKKRWHARPFGGVLKKTWLMARKKGRRQLTARPGANCPCKVREKERQGC